MHLAYLFLEYKSDNSPNSKRFLQNME